MATDHEMRMYALKLFEIMEAVDHTLCVHGKVDCGTPLHDRIKEALSDGNEDPSGQRREPMTPHALDDEPPFEISPIGQTFEEVHQRLAEINGDEE